MGPAKSGPFFMEAKVTKPLHGAEDGQHHPRQILVGEIITGELAAAAVAAGWAVPLVKPPVQAAPIVKALDAAPRNKASSPVSPAVRA